MRLAENCGIAADGLYQQRMPTFADQPAALERPPLSRWVPSWRLLIAIFLGGVIGAAARALLTEVLPPERGEWPWATFGANVVGSFLLGYFATRLQERLPPSTFRRPLLGTGICGALTTFSTFQVELLRMAREHDVALLVGYASASVAGCFVAVYLATAATRRVRVR
jgi:CrcB protein